MTRAARPPPSWPTAATTSSAANVVVSATHDHAAPTLMGIWGHTDPAYLHRVKLAAVQAVREAESNARDAELWSATGSVRGLVSELQGTDQIAGYGVDTELPHPVGARARDRRDARPLRRRPGPRRPVRPERRRQQQVLGRLPRLRPRPPRRGARRHRGHRRGHARPPGADRQRLELRRGRRAGPLHHQRDDARAHPRQADQGHDARRRPPVVHDACREHGAARRDVVQPRRRPARLPRPAERAGRQQRQPAPGTGARSAGSSRSTARSPRRGTRRARIASARRRPSPASATSCTRPRRARPSPRSSPRSSARTRSPTGSAACTSSTTPATSSATTGTRARASTRPSSSRRATSTGSTSAGGWRRTTSTRCAPPATALGLAPTAQNAFAEINDPDAFAQPTIQFYTNRVETADPAVSFYASAKKALKPGSPSTSIGSSAAAQNDGKISWDFGDGTTETDDQRRPGSPTRSRAPGSTACSASVVDNLGNTVQLGAAGLDRRTAHRGRPPAHRCRRTRPDRARRPAGRATSSPPTGRSPTARPPTARPSGAPPAPVQATVTIVDGAGNTATSTVDVG